VDLSKAITSTTRWCGANGGQQEARSGDGELSLRTYTESCGTDVEDSKGVLLLHDIESQRES